MRTKIGLVSIEGEDTALINEMFAAMEGQEVDYTLFFRHLADAADGQNDKLLALFGDQVKITTWLTAWQDRLLRDPLNPDARAIAMNLVNPLYIPRNHRVEEALQAGEAVDMAPFGKLLEVLSAPFTKRDGLERYEEPAPSDFGPYKTFCGT
jgi:uncharacterized protein YdiU (UPF0061 family)